MHPVDQHSKRDSMRKVAEEKVTLEASPSDPSSTSLLRDSATVDSGRDEVKQAADGVEVEEQSRQQQFLQHPRQRPPIPKSKPLMPGIGTMNLSVDGNKDLKTTAIQSAVANTGAGANWRAVNQDAANGMMMQDASKTKELLSSVSVGQGGNERSDISLGGSSRHSREMSLESLPTQTLEHNATSMAAASAQTPTTSLTDSTYYSQTQMSNSLQPQQQQRQQQQQQQQRQQEQQQQQQQPGTDVGLISYEIHNVDIGIDSILNSPRAKDEIVEKSPGGRYLRFSEKLGSGAYKEVFRAYDTSEGIEVAWNVVNLSGVPSLERRYIVNEVKLLEKLNHSNIISFHGSWVNRELEQVIFVTEILSSGTLKQFINKVQIIRYKIAKRWAVQILKGLEYLHSQEPPIIHRDLKCDNIFINGTSGDLRIGDLGLSTVISNKSKALSVLGTPEFMAPELYDESYDEKVDIYAFGMCMLEIFTKEVPYSECSNPAQIYKKVISGVEPASISRIRSASARDFIRQCLGRRDENERVIRPSASELLGHPFLTKREDDSSQIEVDRPLREWSIQEGTVTNSGGTYTTVNTEPVKQSNSGSDRMMGTQGRVPSPADNTMGSVQNIDADQLPLVPQLPKPPLSPRRQNTDFIDIPTVTANDSAQQQMQPDQGSKHQEPFDFDSMPDREINMKPVKVLMGRGHEVDVLNGHNHLPIPVQTDAKSQMSIVPSPLPSPPPIQVPPSSYQVQPLTKSNDESAVANTSLESNERRAYQMPCTNAIPKYLQMATILDDDKKNFNDVIQLGLYLSVGNKKHVQLGFHLVQDDPIQVAKEIVAELNLPTEAVLEISENISSIARQARIQQDMHKTMLVQQVTPATTQRNQNHLNRSASFNNENKVESNVEGAVTSVQKESFISSAKSGIPTIPLQTPPLPGATSNTNQPNMGQDICRPQQNSSLSPSHVANANASITPLVAPSSNTCHNKRSSFSTTEAPGQMYHPLASKQDPPPPLTKSGFANDGSSTEAQTSANPVTGVSGSILSHVSPPAVNEVSHVHHHDTDEDEMSNSEEIQQLKIEHEKKLLRAQKVFHTRMESLQRSLEEKEAQHLKTLEKHERERAALEKRLKMAEEEQQKRLKQLKEEFVLQREMAKQSKKSSTIISQSVAPNQLSSLEGEEATSALEARLSNFDLISLSDKNNNINGDTPDATIKAPSPPVCEEEIFPNR